MATCKDCKFYGVCIMNRRQADADVSSCKVYEAGMVFDERDLVEVVRCKDCKHFIQAEHGCNHFGYYSHTPWVDEVDFCSYGERREGE